MSVAIAICTFGNLSEWEPLAVRAYHSAQAQTVKSEIIRIHGLSLHEARNRALNQTKAEHIIFLDADDELDPLYVEKMLECSGDIRVPLVQYIFGQDADQPKRLEPRENLLCGNWIVIGAMLNRARFKQLGGFNDLPVLEDHEAWVRCWIDGWEFGYAEAIYKVHVRKGRNTQDLKLNDKVFLKTVERYTPFAIRKGLLRQ